MTESQISKQIQEYLKKKMIFHWRSQVYRGTVKSGAWLDTGVEGLADITCMLKGSHLYIEIKTATGKQKTVQKAFQEMCRMNGHFYLVARSVEDVKNYLISIGEV
ncbi:MAG: hypothetical protein GY928_08180 [Colwellia sp.]|nr:hypothetical protein [Colwellia sp.]